MKKNFIDAKDDFVSSINRQKKLTAILLAVIVVIVVIVVSLFIIVPKVQANIRASEVQSLVGQEKLAKKANYLNIKTADQEISEKTAMTVLFAAPSGDTYDKVITVLKDTEIMRGFTHSIFIYPMVYNAEKIEKKYGVKKDEVTVIFFESGKEKNRLPINQNIEMTTMLIPALNQLPMSSLQQQSVQPPKNTTTQQTTQTTEQSQAVQSSAEEQPVETEPAQ